MIDVTKPSEIWKAYENGRDYKRSIELYETVEENERFYVGDQWHGLDAPNITKPVLNHTKRVASMLIAKVGADDIATNVQPFLKNEESEDVAKMLSREVDKTVELTNLKEMAKRGLRNAAVDGDTCIYTYWDADAPTGQDSKGMIAVELIENINVYFANAHTPDVQGQRHIIIARRMLVDDVKDRAKENGVSKDDIELIVPDTDTNQGEVDNSDTLCTLLTVLYKKDGTVRAVEATERCIVRKEWDTELKRYPIAWMPWEPQRANMHGRAAITDVIPNQIAINKAYAGLLRVIERMGFPTLILNRTYMQKDEKGRPMWTGQPGSVMQVEGPPQDVRNYAAYLEGAPINPSIRDIIDSITSQTRDTMGTNDATTGDVRPDNASAIIALQTADTIPLELTRQSYHAWIEDIVRNMVDMMAANYGQRLVEKQVTDPVTKQVTEEMTMYDFDALDYENMRISVDIGTASMWSEITQMDAINSIFTSGIMDDLNKLKLYLEVIPDKYLNAKAKILAWIEEQQAMLTPETVTPSDPAALNEPYGELPLEYNQQPTIAAEGMNLNV